jgi:hypothetical protein
MNLRSLSMLLRWFLFLLFLLFVMSSLLVFGQEFSDKDARSSERQAGGVVKSTLDNDAHDFATDVVNGATASSRPSVFIDDHYLRADSQFYALVSPDDSLRSNGLQEREREASESDRSSLFLDGSVQSGDNWFSSDRSNSERVLFQIADADVGVTPPATIDEGNPEIDGSGRFIPPASWNVNSGNWTRWNSSGSEESLGNVSGSNNVSIVGQEKPGSLHGDEKGASVGVLPNADNGHSGTFQVIDSGHKLRDSRITCKNKGAQQECSIEQSHSGVNLQLLNTEFRSGKCRVDNRPGVKEYKCQE